MDGHRPAEIIEEDRLVAELHRLGVTYLNNRSADLPERLRQPAQLLADTVCQPGGRVRTAVIALLLLNPGYAKFISSAVSLLNENQALLLKLFYTASVFLQRQYQAELSEIGVTPWQWLPDLFSTELGIPPSLPPKDALHQLGIRHRVLSQQYVNWTGTYENVVHHLIRYKRLEKQCDLYQIYFRIGNWLTSL